MHDINFFSVYKRKKGKSNGIKIFIAVFLALLLLGNGVLIGGYLVVTANMQNSIDDLKAKIDSEETRQMIAEANLVRQEAILTSEYLNILKSSTLKLDRMDTMKTSLLDKIRALTPATTVFDRADFHGLNIGIECRSSLVTDPMDMYRAFQIGRASCRERV